MGCCLGEDANLAAAPLAQSLFFRPKVFRPRERRPPMGRRRHVIAVEALVPPDATRVATRGTAHSATVYTNGQKRHREAVFANLCTLLRPHGLLARPSRCNSVHKWQKTVSRGHSHRSVYTPAFPCLSTTAQQCTHMIQNGSERPFSPICVHSLHLNDRSRDRTGLRVPRRRRPHGPRDARALGPDAHAARAVTQLPTYSSSRSLVITNPYHEAL